jgi:hypothetical protein
MTQFPTPVDPQASTNRMSDEELRRLAAEQAEELGLRNQAAIEMARQDAANRLSGTTNYGQAVEQPVADYLARNTTQRDVQIAQGQAQRPGERPGDYLDRMNLDPNAGLNQAYMEERTARQTQHYAERERAIREVLSRGVQNVGDPTARRLASEFVMAYPAEYNRIRAEMRGEPAARETIPFDQELLDRITQDSMYGREERMADADRRSQQQALNRFNSLDQSQKSMYLRAAGGDTNKAAELYMQQLRKERGIDPESRRARQNDIARSRAISAISGRHGGDPTMVRRAIENWNSRNPSNPLTPEDFGMPAAGQNVTARPGEVVEVDDVRNVNPRNVSPGAIMVDATGAWRAARRPDGSMYQQPVLEDRNSGFHFPDPDKYGTQDAFDNAMTRQDRVDMRQAILNSGNSVLANEQRRLEAARQAAASSIPEIRDAGIKEVNELERDLHWRYVTEAASLAGPAPIGGRQEIELGPAPGQSRPRSERPITIKDVNDRVSEIMSGRDFANFELYDRFQTMTPEDREQEAYRILQEERQPYALADAYEIQQLGAAPAVAPAAAPAVARGLNANQIAEAAITKSDEIAASLWPEAVAIVRGEGTVSQKVAKIDMWAESMTEKLQAENIWSADIAAWVESLALMAKRGAGWKPANEATPAPRDPMIERTSPPSASPDAISASTGTGNYRRQGYAPSQPTRFQ